MSDLFALKVRLSFPDLSRSLVETGRVMTAWARAAAALLAPELEWTTAAQFEQDLDGDDRWGTSLAVELVGRALDGRTRGRARVRLTAGGDSKSAGASSAIDVEALAPLRILSTNNHCDVTHWDLVAAPVSAAQIVALRRALEDTLGRSAEEGGARREPLLIAPQLVTTSATASDAALWLEDLRSVGIRSRGQAGPAGLAVFLDGAEIDNFDVLDEARVVLGEVLSEAGHDDWHERARDILVRLPAC